MAPPRVRGGTERVVPVGYSLPPAYRDAMDNEAAARGISKSELLRQMIERFGWVPSPAGAAELVEREHLFRDPAGKVVAKATPPTSRPGYRSVRGLAPPKKAT